MYILNESRFHEALKRKGYRSIGALAQSLGVHRNTIHHYLSGNPVFPEGLVKILTALDLSPTQALDKQEAHWSSPYEGIAPFVDRLHAEYPNVTLVLFGSRVAGRGHRYSDWDLGVFSRIGLPHERYRRIVIKAEELAEEFPFLVDVVNLNRADLSFLREISRHWVFLTGSQEDWMDLQRKAYS